jgi:hypothetical protein
LKAVGILVVSSTSGTSVVDRVSRPQALNTKANAVELKPSFDRLLYLKNASTPFSSLIFSIFINFTLQNDGQGKSLI